MDTESESPNLNMAHLNDRERSSYMQSLCTLINCLNCLNKTHLHSSAYKIHRHRRIQCCTGSQVGNKVSLVDTEIRFPHMEQLTKLKGNLCIKLHMKLLHSTGCPMYVHKNSLQSAHSIVIGSSVFTQVQLIVLNELEGIRRFLYPCIMAILKHM